jgi:hypothetical protein
MAKEVQESGRGTPRITAPRKKAPNWTREQCIEMSKKAHEAKALKMSSEKLRKEIERLELEIEYNKKKAEAKRSARMLYNIESVETDIAQIDDADKRANRKMQFYGLNAKESGGDKNAININAPSTIQFLTRRIEPGEKVKELEEVKPE